MTDSQDKQMRDYLLEKNLSISLLMEVQDHMSSQIQELQKKNNVHFEEAFKKVLLNWSADLAFPKYNIQFDLQDSTYFEKTIVKRNQFDIFKSSISYVLFAFVLLLIMSHLTTESQFMYILLSLVVVSIVLPFYQYLQNLEAFKLVKKFDNYKLTGLQNLNHLSLSFAGGFAAFYYGFELHSRAIYKTLNFQEMGFLNISLVLIFFYFWLNAVCFMAQRKYLEEINRVKPFLKYLKPSS